MLRSAIRLATAVVVVAVSASRAYAYEIPEFFGGYAVVDDKLQELTAVKVNLKGFEINKTAIPAFTGLPNKLPTLMSFTPALILFDQGVSVGQVHLVKLSPIPLGKSKDDGFAWVIGEDVGVKVKPLEQAGMFYFKPDATLSSGYYALYGGQAIGNGVTSGNVFAFEVKHPKQDEIYKLFENFMGAVKMGDAAASAEMSIVFTGNEAKKSFAPSSVSYAEKFKKPFFYTMGGEIYANGIREGTEEAMPGTKAYYCLDLLITGAMVTVSVNGKTLTGDSPKQAVVSEMDDGSLKVYTIKDQWVFGGCS